MIITISGTPGTGKSVTAKFLCKKLGLKHFSIGDIRGEMALERGITIDQLNEIGKNEDWTDREADRMTEKLGQEDDNFVIDGRIAFHFIPHSIKVFLKGDLRLGATRIFKEQRPDEKHHDSIENLYQMLKGRIQSDDDRYKKWYGLNFKDPKHYDLVIETDNITPGETADIIIEYLRENDFL